MGGEVGFNLGVSDGTSLIVFKHSHKEDIFDHIYGVHSNLGPVRLNYGGDNFLIQGGSNVHLSEPLATGEQKLDPKYLKQIDGNSLEWGQAFEDSRDDVLRDQELMGRIREERIKGLDKAFEIVSKPIDFDAVGAKQSDSSVTQFGVAHAVPEDRVKMDRESVEQAALDAKNTLGHSQ